VKYKDIEVVSRVTGKPDTALLFTCSKCEGVKWLIFNVYGHSHLQCATCGTTFCQSDNCQGPDELKLAGS
jgi:hypothetical protein